LALLMFTSSVIRWTYLRTSFIGLPERPLISVADPTPFPDQEDEQWTADAALAFFRIFIGCFAGRSTASATFLCH
jgi:hypothetical protein